MIAGEEDISICGVRLTPAIRDTLLLACLKCERQIDRRLSAEEMDLIIVSFARRLAELGKNGGVRL